MENHSIDQLIICSIFAFNKMEKLDLLFTDIIDQYKEYSLHNKEMFD